MEENRCPGCMEIKNGTVCGHCGFDEEKQNEHHQLQIGTVLQEKYVVGRVLGQGGFGITYLCWNRYLERKVAIKEYYPSFFVERHTGFSTKVTCKTERMEEAFAENRLRFLREAKLLAKLEAVPQIVSILDFFEANNTAYIVMEYLQGNDLRTYVRKKGGRLTPKETFSILRPVMAALAQVHEAGLVHRDISPDNIMLQPDGSVKLMDFGAARSVNNPDVDKELTQATQAIVKHGFAPIEQYSAKGSIGPWTDEYALCATMYYCMTGRVPMNATDRIEEETEIDWDVIPGLTAHQKEILRKGMAIRAKDRYRSIQELMGALFGQPKPEPKPVQKPQPEPKPEPEPVKQPAKGNKKGIAIIAGLACAVLVLVLILSAGDRKLPQMPTEPPVTVSAITEPSMEETVSVPESAPAETLNTDGLETETGPSYTDTDIFRDEKVVNILLVGTDERTEGFLKAYSADANILVSINKAEKTVKLVSFSRGMAVKMLDGPYKENYEWLANVHRWAGPDAVLQEMENSFKIELDYYVRVNFYALETVVNSIGGIEMELTAAEAEYLNNYRKGQWNLTAGMNMLNGQQAVAFARCRGIDDDWHRMERQRKCILAVVNKLKGSSFSVINDLSNLILPMIQTNLSKKEIAELILYAPKFLESEFGQMTIPIPDSYGSMTCYSGSSGWALDYGKNNKALHEFLFGAYTVE